VVASELIRTLSLGATGKGKKNNLYSNVVQLGGWSNPQQSGGRQGGPGGFGGQGFGGQQGGGGGPYQQNNVNNNNRNLFIPGQQQHQQYSNTQQNTSNVQSQFGTSSNPGHEVANEKSTKTFTKTLRKL